MVFTQFTGEACGRNGRIQSYIIDSWSTTLDRSQLHGTGTTGGGCKKLVYCAGTIRTAFVVNHVVQPQYYLFSNEFVVELRDDVVLGFHLLLEVCDELVRVVVGPEYFILTNPETQKRTYEYERGLAPLYVRHGVQKVNKMPFHTWVLGLSFVVIDTGNDSRC